MTYTNKVSALATTATMIGLLTRGVNAEGQNNLETIDNWFSSNRFGVGAYGGTLGIGGHVTYDVSQWLYIKGQLGGFSYNANEEVDDVNYDGDLSLFFGGITANFLPFYDTPANGFRVFLGLFGVDNNLGISASSPGQQVDLGDSNTFTLGAGDRLDGEGYFSGFSPYVGLGWDWNFGNEDQFTLSIDAGVLFVGEPEVSLTARGTFADFAAQNPTLNLQDEIDAELASIREDIEDFQYYPVVSLGFTWRI